jgi:hypothetical protein
MSKKFHSKFFQATKTAYTAKMNLLRASEVKQKRIVFFVVCEVKLEPARSCEDMEEL